MSVSSREFQVNAIKMIEYANEHFDKGNYVSQVANLHSAKQDIDNAIWKAERDCELRMQMQMKV